MSHEVSTTAAPKFDPPVRAKRDWWWYEVSLALCLLIGWPVFFVVWQCWDYRAGRAGTPPPFFTNVFLIMYAFGVGTILLFLGTIRHWRRLSWGRRFFLGFASLWVGLAFGSCGTIPVLGTWMRPSVLLGPHTNFAGGFLERMRERADLAAIRAWAREHPDFQDHASVGGLEEAYVSVSNGGRDISLL